ncbi:MAG: MFS transporter [Novosphingobium sp.]|nr:MFS transporter [Novosphingobium sp.]
MEGASTSSTDLRAGLNTAGKIAVVLGGVLPGIATGTISVMLPGISDAFSDGGNDLQIKMVATAAGLGMMVGAPLGGYLSDRLGKMPVLAFVTLLFGLAGSAAVFAGALWHLIALRFVIGFCSGTISVCYLALIGDAFQDQSQSRWLGYNGAAATFVLMLLNPVAGALVDTGWRNGFLIYALAFPTLGLVFAGVPRGRSNFTKPDARSEAGSAFRMPWAAMVLAIVAGTIATGTMLYWPFRLREIGVTSARDLGFYVLPNVLLVGISAFLYGFVRRYLAMAQVFMACGFCSALGLSIIAFSTHPSLTMVGLAIEGIAVGLITPNLTMFTISLSTEATRARTLGVMKGVYFGSPFLTQFVLEWVSGQSGPAGALLAIAGMSTGLGIFMVPNAVRRPRT